MPSQTAIIPPLARSTETGALGVFQLKRLWSGALAVRAGRPTQPPGEGQLNRLVTDALGVGLEQVQEHLFQMAPTFEAFERWIVATAGAPEPSQVERINAAVTGAEVPPATRRRLDAIEAMEPVLTTQDLAHWAEHGYVILHDAIPEETRSAAERAIWRHLGARPDDPGSWRVPLSQGIMSSLFQDPAFTAIRQAARIQKAFAQLWGTADLWPSCDRGGFNPPLRPGELFRASDLHWDVSLVRPIPFGTQGILYLTDTPPEQGAFRCVPGFHRRLDAWLDALPPGADPRTQDLHALGVKAIGGRAGDLVIWDHLLPHGASPNRGALPRIVQYLNFYPACREAGTEWL